PRLDRQELKKLLDASRAGRPGPTSPPAQQQASPTGAMAQTPPQPQPTQPPQPAPPPAQMAKLQSPPVTRKPTFNSETMSANKTIEQAARAAAVGRGAYAGDNGDLGLGQRQTAARMGPTEVTPDTQGDEYGPDRQR